MLSERDRRVLTEIERGVAEHDPAFARRMRRRQGDTRMGHGIVIALSGATTLLCMLLSLPGPGFVALVLAAVAAWSRGLGPMPPRENDTAGAHR